MDKAPGGLIVFSEVPYTPLVDLPYPGLGPEDAFVNRLILEGVDRIVLSPGIALVSANVQGYFLFQGFAERRLILKDRVPLMFELLLNAADRITSGLHKTGKVNLLIPIASKLARNYIELGGPALYLLESQ